MKKAGVIYVCGLVLVLFLGNAMAEVVDGVPTKEAVGSDVERLDTQEYPVPAMLAPKNAEDAELLLNEEYLAKVNARENNKHHTASSLGESATQDNAQSDKDLVIVTQKDEQEPNGEFIDKSKSNNKLNVSDNSLVQDDTIKNEQTSKTKDINDNLVVQTNTNENNEANSKLKEQASKASDVVQNTVNSVLVPNDTTNDTKVFSATPNESIEELEKQSTDNLNDQSKAISQNSTNYNAEEAEGKLEETNPHDQVIMSNNAAKTLEKTDDSIKSKQDVERVQSDVTGHNIEIATSKKESSVDVNSAQEVEQSVKQVVLADTLQEQQDNIDVKLSPQTSETNERIEVYGVTKDSASSTKEVDVKAVESIEQEQAHVETTGQDKTTLDSTKNESVKPQIEVNSINTEIADSTFNTKTKIESQELDEKFIGKEKFENEKQAKQNIELQDNNNLPQMSVQNRVVTSKKDSALGPNVSVDTSLAPEQTKDTEVEAKANVPITQNLQQLTAKDSADLSKNKNLFSRAYLERMYLPYFYYTYALPQQLDHGVILKKIRLADEGVKLVYEIGVEDSMGPMDLDGNPSDNRVQQLFCRIALSDGGILHRIEGIVLAFFHGKDAFFSKNLTYSDCAWQEEGLVKSNASTEEQGRLDDEFVYAYQIHKQSEQILTRDYLENYFVPYALERIAEKFDVIETNPQLTLGTNNQLVFSFKVSNESQELINTAQFVTKRIDRTCKIGTYSDWILPFIEGITYEYYLHDGKKIREISVDSSTCKALHEVTMH